MSNTSRKVRNVKIDMLFEASKQLRLFLLIEIVSS